MRAGYTKSKKLFSITLAFTLSLSLLCPMGHVRGETSSPIEKDARKAHSNALDIIHFGNIASEAAHDFEEKLSVSGVDDRAEAEYRGTDNKLAGGGLGHGLTYRYIKPSPDTNQSLDGKLEFKLKADTNKQNYLSIRLSGSQQGRGNLMLYGPDGDNSILNPHFGREFSELDNGYEDGAPFLGRYYYNTYLIPKDMVHADGTVRLSIMSTGKFSAYGNNTYGHQKENSKYIYSAATHTDPFYIPEDEFTGEKPSGAPAKSDTDTDAYTYLQLQSKELLELIMSWQIYGQAYEAFKTKNNEFLEGAVVTYTPLTELAKFNGASREAWAKKVTGQAINFQNWSPMMASEVFANAYMNEWSGEHYQSEEMLDRILKLYDFMARAQDSQGAWCVPTTGQNAYQWIGTALDGSGNRGTGETWPLLSLGTDAMVQTLLQLHHYILNSEDEIIKQRYFTLLDEKGDYDLDGVADMPRRTAYIEMFAKLRDYQFSPVKGDFYDPNTRAGTANQDFGFAYDANRLVQLLFDSMSLSDVSQPSDIDELYQVKDPTPYLHQLQYKLGEMVDGEKWFSDQGVGLEGGASHGGWAGEYGLLLLKVINAYAESAAGSPEVEDILGDQSVQAYETAKYFLRPSVTVDGVNVLISEMYGGSRNAANGQKIAYPIGGYTALERGSTGALRILLKYMEDNHAFGETFKQEIYQDRTPHVYTRVIELQEILNYYKQAEQLKQEMQQKGESLLLPMEDGHPDFAWADPDAQAVVFKNKGDQVYITFNYRRGNWKYNDFTRIHFTTDRIDRLANVAASSKGGTYIYEDRETHPEGKAYTHTRADGFSEVRYGKYAVGLNQSKDEARVGQTGKVYFLNTRGIKKAKDLISGKVYDAAGQEDIVVQVQPRQTVVLEIMKEEPVYNVTVTSVADDKVLKVDSIPASLGQAITVDAPQLDGYKLMDKTSVALTVSQEPSDNIVTFHYDKNSPPTFRENGVKGTEPDYQTRNLGQAEGHVELDDSGVPVAITSAGDNHFAPTFAYQEVTGDVQIEGRLETFETTKTDKEYFSLLLTDSIDLTKANYVQLRHFPNNNNILLVSHRANQGDTITGYWAGDMNNKKVPIDYRLIKAGNTIRYEFSLDGGKTYQKTSKPSIPFDMGNKLYAGAAMTTMNGVSNTAKLSSLTITSDDKVLAPFEKGKELRADLAADDLEGDDVTYRIHGLPEGAQWDEAAGQMDWVPDKPGSYMIKVQASDLYHQSPSVKTKEIIVGTSATDTIHVKESLDRVPLIRDIHIREGETASFVAKSEGASVQVSGDYPEAAEWEEGTWLWNTTNGDAGEYHAVITYQFDEALVTRLVKITVDEVQQGIDYDKDWKVQLSNLQPRQAVSGREFIFDVETLVPVDGFGLNVSVRELPQGATFENRTFRWRPGDGDVGSEQSIVFEITQPNGKKSTGTLIVNVVQGIKPASITLNRTELELGLSEQFKLEATVLPETADNRTVIWSSSNDKIATVDQKGRVTAIEKGQTQITAKTVSGNLSVTASVSVGQEQGASDGAPGQPILSSNEGHDNGLHDGNYEIKMNMWWGNNGTTFNLYEDDVMISSEKLPDQSPSAQETVIPVKGKRNGTYEYRAELVNRFGKSISKPLTVEVTDAAPAKPVLSRDNWDNDGDYTIRMDLWWGTNGLTYRLYENDVLVDEQMLNDTTPSSQTLETQISNKPPGMYEYVAELENPKGITRSEPVTVEVKK